MARAIAVGLPSHPQASSAGVSNRAAAKPAGPCLMVIFGSSGDLAKRKLIPALYHLTEQGLLPKDFAVVGFARRDMKEDGFRAYLNEEVRKLIPDPVDEAVWKELVGRFYFIPGDFGDTNAFAKLKAALTELDQKYKAGGNALFYLATAPEFFTVVVDQCAKQGLLQENNGSWRRVIVEKPFGKDLESAKLLNRELHKYLDESQIYRIDHYLGKETVQNMMVFRFANGIFEPIWNRRYIDHVQITVTEDIGVENRGGYYDEVGALRDMVPNHIFQLISLTAMEPPISFAADSVRDEQSKVLRAIQPMSPEELSRRVVRGQYGEGTMHGAKVPAYRSEPRVSPKSNTETFVALKLFIDSWRWADVPFYIRTGKRMSCRATEIVIQFKRVPLMLFRDVSVQHLHRNQLVIRIQPDEGIALSLQAKVPGPTVKISEVNMDFQYSDYFNQSPATGYERLLYDCMLGDATLFKREDMVEAGWEAVSSILESWKAPAKDFPNYAAGTYGPKESEDLLHRDGRHWRECSK